MKIVFTKHKSKLTISHDTLQINILSSNSIVTATEILHENLIQEKNYIQIAAAQTKGTFYNI